MEPGEKIQGEADRGYYWKAKPLVYLVYVARKLREKPMTISELVEEFKKDWGREEGEEDEWLRRLKQELREPPDDRTIRDYVKKALYALEAAGFVRKTGDKWEVYWYEFGSQKEYYMYLRKLMEECVFRDRDTERAEISNLISTLDRELISDVRVRVACEKLLPELRQSYPEIYNRIKKAAKAVRDRGKAEHEYRRKIREIVEARGFKGVEAGVFFKKIEGPREIDLDMLGSIIYHHLASGIKDHVKLEESVIQALGVERKELESLVKKIISSKVVWKLWNKWKRLEREENKALNELKEALIKLYSHLDIQLSATSTSSTK